MFQKKLFKTYVKIHCNCDGSCSDYSKPRRARAKITTPLESSDHGGSADTSLFAIRPKIKKWKNGKNWIFFSQKYGTFCENAGSFPKILPEFPGNSLSYMGIYITEAEHKIFNYSWTSAPITLKVGAKHFLQFILTDCGGISAIHQVQRILQTAKIRLFTHHKQDFNQFTI